MKEIIIIGAGGHGAELDDYIFSSQNKSGVEEYNLIGFFDDNPEAYSSYQLSAPFLGGIRNHKIRTDCHSSWG